MNGLKNSSRRQRKLRRKIAAATRDICAAARCTSGGWSVRQRCIARRQGICCFLRKNFQLKNWEKRAANRLEKAANRRGKKERCSVAHGSGNTGMISDMCVGFAKELGLRYRQEPCNNLIIWKDASAGYEASAPIILQGHIDTWSAPKRTTAPRIWPQRDWIWSRTVNGCGRTKRRWRR